LRMILRRYFCAFPGISIANLPTNMFARRRGRSRWKIRSLQGDVCSPRSVESSLTHKLWVQELPSEIIAQQLEPRLTDYSGNSFDAAPRAARDGEARGWMGSEGLC
jgi:hypothetical protein